MSVDDGSGFETRPANLGRTGGKDNVAAIVEETADVEIMLEQLKENYGIADRVAVYKAEKLKLIERRLNELDKKTV